MMVGLVFIFGLVFGSFFNVCIYRLPKEQSIVSPGSHCPGCKKDIAWYDNIPLVSFLFLGGKCRDCKSVIPMRYFLVELLTGMMWVLLWLGFSLTWKFFLGVLFCSLLLIAMMTDIEEGIIPDAITLPGLGMGLALSFVFPELHGVDVGVMGLKEAFLGLLIGGGMIWGADILGRLLFKKDSMGGGDIKLLAFIGTFIGLQKTLYVFFVAPFLALPFALYAKYVKKDETMVFGPYLAVAGVSFFVYGDWVSPWLFR